MNVLVTGTDGYIGSVLGPYLEASGHTVVGLDAGFFTDGELYVPGRPFSTRRHVDVRRLRAEDLQGFDAVIHLAELSNDPLGNFNPEVTYQINQLGTVRLARLARKAGVPRFVHSSSCSVYGLGEDGFRTEESATDPQTAYARCKVLVEQHVGLMANDDFSPTFLRNATAYGPSPRMRFDIVLNNLSGLAWTTGEIALTSDGSPWRPLVHVRDIAHAMRCAIEAPRDVVHNQIFNVGSTEQNYQVKDIAAVVAEAFPGCRLTLGRSDGDDRSYRVSFEKISTLLPGFECRFDPQLAARELHELFGEIGLTEERFRFRAFTRLKQLQYLVDQRLLDRQLFWQTGASLERGGILAAG
jgi:nucleoside-diphosphate-sugar epimerase